nr:glutaminase [Rhodopirellula sp. SM50]
MNQSASFQEILDRIHGSAIKIDSGKVASYIPQLGGIDPNKFGMHLVTIGGDEYGVGDNDERFSIQSDGFEVFVQLVMAAMTTEPSVTDAAAVGCSKFSFEALKYPLAFAPPSALKRASSSGLASAAAPSKTVWNDSLTPPSATRSCGRVGPATLGSTLLKSKSRISLKFGATASSVRNKPC